MIASQIEPSMHVLTSILTKRLITFRFDYQFLIVLGSIMRSVEKQIPRMWVLESHLLSTKKMRIGKYKELKDELLLYAKRRNKFIDWKGTVSAKEAYRLVLLGYSAAIMVEDEAFGPQSLRRRSSNKVVFSPGELLDPYKENSLVAFGKKLEKNQRYHLAFYRILSSREEYEHLKEKEVFSAKELKESFLAEKEVREAHSRRNGKAKLSFQYLLFDKLFSLAMLLFFAFLMIGKAFVRGGFPYRPYRLPLDRFLLFSIIVGVCFLFSSFILAVLASVKRSRHDENCLFMFLNSTFRGNRTIPYIGSAVSKLINYGFFDWANYLILIGMSGLYLLCFILPMALGRFDIFLWRNPFFLPICGGLLAFACFLKIAVFGWGKHFRNQVLAFEGEQKLLRPSPEVSEVYHLNQELSFAQFFLELERTALQRIRKDERLMEFFKKRFGEEIRDQSEYSNFS